MTTHNNSRSREKTQKSSKEARRDTFDDAELAEVLRRFTKANSRLEELGDMFGKTRGYRLVVTPSTDCDLYL